MTTYTSQYPPVQTLTYVNSTTWYTPTYYYPWYATDPTRNITADHQFNSWASQAFVTTNQRFHIDLGSAKIIKRLYYENFHFYGTYTDHGVKTFTVWGSNNATAFATLTYAINTNWTQITASATTFDRHIAADQADAKYVTLTNSTAYRYYAIKFADNWGGVYHMGLRRIVLQTSDQPSPPTNVSATDGTYTDKVVVTWTKSTGATGYKVYRGDTLVATLGDVATYSDTDATAPTITAGAAAASDGTSGDHVELTISGHSASSGASVSYTVVATNSYGSSSASSAATGYRSVGSLSYQWQRSAADSNASFSDISGGTTATYYDTAAPEEGVGRFFRCALSADGAATVYSSADRGYRSLVDTEPVAPTVTTTDPVTDVDCTTATVAGNITDTGGANCSVRGVCYNTTGSPDTSDPKISEYGNYGPGVFTENLTGLTAETTYYCKAYAKNSVGTSYGDEVEFTTPANALTVVTSSVSSVTATTAKVYGAITATGAEKATIRGVCYAIFQTPTTSNAVVQRTGTFGVAVFSATLAGLIPNTTYYVRAFATNTDGTEYGEDVDFTTDAVTVPTTTTWTKVPATTSTWLSETNQSSTWIPEQNGHTGRMIYVDTEVIYVDSERYTVDGSDVYDQELHSG